MPVLRSDCRTRGHVTVLSSYGFGLVVVRPQCRLATVVAPCLQVIAHPPTEEVFSLEHPPLPEPPEEPDAELFDPDEVYAAHLESDGDAPEFPEHPLDDPHVEDPPFEEYDPDDRPSQVSSSNSHHRGKRRTPRTARMGAEVYAAVRDTLAAVDGSSAAEVESFVAQIRVSTKALEELSDDHARVVRGALEVLDFEVSLCTEETPISLAACALLPLAAQDVRDFFESLADAAPLPDDQLPVAAWLALCNEVQARRVRRDLANLVSAIDQRSPITDQLAIYDRLEPPATRVAVVRESGLRTFDQALAEFEAQGTELTPYRLSSGFPLLDATQTSPSDELGVIAPGEMLLVLGATGTGKSSFEYAVHRASTLDLTLRYPDAISMLLHTEESPMDKAKAIGLLRNQRWHFLAKNILIENIGSSRRRIGELVFESVADAVRKAERSGRHPREFVVHKIHIDYIQAIAEQGEESGSNKAVATTAELILRGLQECNPEEIEKFSGVNFAQYTGMRWPDELEHHRIACVVYGQLRKGSADAIEYYDPRNRKCSLADFTLEDTSDEPSWVDPNGSPWCWEVKTGDFRLFTKNDIYGSAKPLQNATSVLLLHRSRPQKNPISWYDDDGHPHLADERGRLILDKARNGQQALYVPMSFNVMPDGFRAQYFDPIGAEMVSQGALAIEEDFHANFGDPMIPKRPRRSVFDDLHY